MYKRPSCESWLYRFSVLGTGVYGKVDERLLLLRRNLYILLVKGRPFLCNELIASQSFFVTKLEVMELKLNKATVFK